MRCVGFVIFADVNPPCSSEFFLYFASHRRTASTALDLVGGSSHGSNGSVGSLRSYSSGGKRRTIKKKGVVEKNQEDTQLIYCSNMYSVDFVLEELKKCETSPSIVNVGFEDLIERNEGVTIQAVKTFLVDTTDATTVLQASGARNISLAPINGDKTPKNKKATTQKGPQKRVWQSIAFTDCISDAEDYRAYLEKKKKFLAGLNRLLSMKKMNLTLPIVFKAKIEIHSMLGVFDIIELLQQIERDEGISKAKFPGFSGNLSQIADEFAKSVDAESLEWTGQPVEIILRYAKEDMNVRASGNSVDLDISCGKNPSTAVIGECVKALENILYTDGPSTNASPLGMSQVQ